MMCIGYTGCEAFDIILYIGRSLTKLNYRVLFVDLSGNGALTNSIKHGMGLDSTKVVINYRDINYIRKIPGKDELELFQSGVVLIYYGMKYEDKFPVSCQKMNVVINTLPNVIDEVNSLMQNPFCHAEGFNLLIRDIITIDDVEVVKNKMTLPAKADKTFHLYYEVRDYECAVNCQRTQVVRFTKITKSMERSIVEQIQDILPQMKRRRIRKAISAAKRGV